MDNSYIRLIKNSDVWNQEFENSDDILDKGILNCEYISDVNKAMLSIVRTGHLIEQIVELKLSKYNLSMAQKNVLEAIYFRDSQKLSQSELSKYIFSSKANVSTLLTRMEEKGLIQREDVSKREKHIALTKDGKKLIELIYSELGSKQHKTIFKNELETKNLIRVLLEVRNKVRAHGENK